MNLVKLINEHQEGRKIHNVFDEIRNTVGVMIGCNEPDIDIIYKFQLICAHMPQIRLSPVSTFYSGLLRQTLEEHNTILKQAHMFRVIDSLQFKLLIDTVVTDYENNTANVVCEALRLKIKNNPLPDVLRQTLMDFEHKCNEDESRSFLEKMSDCIINFTRHRLADSSTVDFMLKALFSIAKNSNNHLLEGMMITTS